LIYASFRYFGLLDILYEVLMKRLNLLYDSNTADAAQLLSQFEKPLKTLPLQLQSIFKNLEQSRLVKFINVQI